MDIFSSSVQFKEKNVVYIEFVNLEWNLEETDQCIYAWKCRIWNNKLLYIWVLKKPVLSHRYNMLITNFQTGLVIKRHGIIRYFFKYINDLPNQTISFSCQSQDNYS